MPKIYELEASVSANKRLTERLYLMDITAPEIANAILPGQFIHLQVPGMEGHILRRPFSVFYVDKQAGTITVLYQTVGFGSTKMTTIEPGCPVSVMGPIGHGWQAVSPKLALLVAGGVGGAPLFMHAADLVARGVQVDVVLGAQTKDALVVLPQYTELLGHEPFIATDDGSYGHAGFCTDVVVERLAAEQYDYCACCGPEPMMHIVSDTTLAAGVPTFISLEKRMACGIGACLSCVVETKQGKRRSCVDGPVFDAAEVLW